MSGTSTTGPSASTCASWPSPPGRSCAARARRRPRTAPRWASRSPASPRGRRPRLSGPLMYPTLTVTTPISADPACPALRARVRSGGRPARRLRPGHHPPSAPPPPARGRTVGSSPRGPLGRHHPLRLRRAVRLGYPARRRRRVLGGGQRLVRGGAARLDVPPPVGVHGSAGAHALAAGGPDPERGDLARRRDGRDLAPLRQGGAELGAQGGVRRAPGGAALRRLRDRRVHAGLPAHHGPARREERLPALLLRGAGAPPRRPVRLRARPAGRKGGLDRAHPVLGRCDLLVPGRHPLLRLRPRSELPPQAPARVLGRRARAAPLRARR